MKEKKSDKTNSRIPNLSMSKNNLPKIIQNNKLPNQQLQNNLDSKESKFNSYKIASYLSYYIIPSLILLYLLVGLLIDINIRPVVVYTGTASFYLLVILLYLKPLAVITNNDFLEKLLGYRRQLGVLTFYLAIFHGIGLMFYLGIFSATGYQKLFNIYGGLFPGFLALIGMVIIGLTSNNLSMIRLGKNWKRLQMLVYPTFLFATWHYYKVDDNIIYLIIFGVYVILKGFQHYFHEKYERERKDLVEYNKFQDRRD